jgi:predicted nuclease with TOPRIM domain
MVAMVITSELIAAVIGSAGATGVISGVVSYAKDRKKDLATAKLTDVQALQQQVSLMDQVTRFLRAENERLQADYNQSEEARRAIRKRMAELEEELQKVKRNAAVTQQQCEELSRQLKAFLRGDEETPPAKPS